LLLLLLDAGSAQHLDDFYDPEDDDVSGSSVRLEALQVGNEDMESILDCGETDVPECEKPSEKSQLLTLDTQKAPRLKKNICT
jgi:hypothetical protein